MKRHEIPKAFYERVEPKEIYLRTLEPKSIEEARKLYEKLRKLERSLEENIILAYHFPQAFKINNSYRHIRIGYDKDLNIAILYVPYGIENMERIYDGLPTKEDDEGELIVDTKKFTLPMFHTVVSRITNEVKRWLDYLEEEIEAP